MPAGDRPASFLSCASLAAELDVSESQVTELVADGTLPASENGVWRWNEVLAAIQKLRLPSNTLGTIYVVGFGSYVKIGFTTGPIEYRLAGIQTGAPEKLSVVASIRGRRHIERDLHQRFATHRSYGEWFRVEGTLANWIAEGCKP